MSEISAFIPDGYTETADLKAKTGVYPALSIRFRPCTALEVAQFVDDTRDLSVTASRKRAADVMADHIKEWSLQDVEINSRNVLSVKPQVWKWLWDMVMGANNEEKDTKN